MGTPNRTRRDVLKVGGTAIGAGLFAGCSGSGDGPTETPGDASETATSAAPGTTAARTDSSYTVSIEPVGEVTFDEVPETWVANNGSWADMGIALGLEAPKGVYLTSRYHTHYYDEIDGVSVDGSEIQQLWGDAGVGKEQFYELDADVHVMDPNFLVNRGGWDQSDVDEIAENVGPFFGNSVFSRTYPWHGDYRYYTLYEAFGKLAAVFQRTARYEAFASLHEEFQADLEGVVPAEGERPAAAVLWPAGDDPSESDTFYPYVMSEGTSFKHLTDLRVEDALSNTDVKDFHANRGEIDYETLLEVDPPVVLVRGMEGRTAGEFRDTLVAYMEDHSVASELTAVENGDVHQAGPLYQGPITNLIATERLARALYGVEGDLFDRARVAEIVAGDV